jgi:hypothetical protein
MKTAVKEKSAAIGPKVAHAHHWVIASPEGEFSLGTCKVCGKSKKFPNSAEDNLWQRNVPQSRWTGRADSSTMSGY